MPTYDYRCDACGHQFEEFQSMTAKPLRKCPKCGKAKLKRLIGTGAGIIFKGSGFYETDYRSDNYKKAAKAEKDGPAKTDSTSSTPGTSTTPAATPGKAEPTPKSKPDSGSGNSSGASGTSGGSGGSKKKSPAKD